MREEAENEQENEADDLEFSGDVAVDEGREEIDAELEEALANSSKYQRKLDATKLS